MNHTAWMRVAVTAVLLAGSSAFLGSSFFGSSLHSQQDPIAGLRTRAERSNYEETSTHDDVLQFVAGLDASPLVHVESFGKTEEGRDLPLVVISNPAVDSPDAARTLSRPIVFVQANIHGGEVEGKEATLALARRLVAGDLTELPRQVVVLIAPDYNADGNDRLNVMNRTAQNGPVTGVGTRENARGLDLNRDYMKLDSAEARSLVGVFNRWDPHVAIDLHTTNGSYHGFHLTYAPVLNPNADPRIIAFQRETLLPAVRTAMLQRHQWQTYYFGDFSSPTGGATRSRVDPANPGDVVWRTFDHRPRYGNNYVGLRNRIAILSEAYSYVDFKGRIDASAAFVEEILRATAARASAVLALTSDADRALTDVASPNRPQALGVTSEFRALPEPVEILVGDVTRVPNPRSGREMLQRAPNPVSVRMPDYGIFAPTKSVPVPEGWIIPRDMIESGDAGTTLERLSGHGIRTNTLSVPTTMAIDRFAIARITQAERPFQNRRETRLEGWFEQATITFDAGSIVIPARQPLGRLAFTLLEAESDDGLAAWGIIEGLTAGQPFPIYRITQ